MAALQVRELAGQRVLVRAQRLDARLPPGARVLACRQRLLQLGVVALEGFDLAVGADQLLLERGARAHRGRERAGGRVGATLERVGVGKRRDLVGQLGTLGAQSRELRAHLGALGLELGKSLARRLQSFDRRLRRAEPDFRVRHIADQEHDQHNEPACQIHGLPPRAPDPEQPDLAARAPGSRSAPPDPSAAGPDGKSGLLQARPTAPIA